MWFRSAIFFWSEYSWHPLYPQWAKFQLQLSICDSLDLKWPRHLVFGTWGIIFMVNPPLWAQQLLVLLLDGALWEATGPWGNHLEGCTPVLALASLWFLATMTWAPLLRQTLPALSFLGARWSWTETLNPNKPLLLSVCGCEDCITETRKSLRQGSSANNFEMKHPSH